MTSGSFKNWAAILLPAFLFILGHWLLTALFFSEVVTSCIFTPFIAAWYWKKERRASVFQRAADRPDFCVFLNLLLLILGISLTSSFILTQVRGNISESLPISIVRILGIAIAGPINEELVYRGMVFNRGQRVLGTKGALLLSSVLFGVSHNGLLEIVTSMAVGLILGLVYLRYHSLRNTILVHIGVNLLSFCNVINHLPIPIYVLGVLLLMISVGALIPSKFEAA